MKDYTVINGADFRYDINFFIFTHFYALYYFTDFFFSIF